MGNSRIFDNGTNVGINVSSSPLTILDIGTGTSNALGIGNVSDTISSGDLIGAISFISRDASTNSSGGVSNIRSYATTTYNSGSVSADLRFYTTNAVQNTTQAVLFGTEAMRITSAGYVWINGGISGFTGSEAGLQVPNGARISQQLLLHNPSNTALQIGLSCVGSASLLIDGDVGISRTPSSGYKLDIQGNGGLRILDNDVLRSIILLPPTSSTAANLESSSANGLNINSSNASGNINFLTSGSTKMRITSGGIVGIGTDNPSNSTKLEVLGTAGAQIDANQQLHISAPTTTVGHGAGIRLNAASGAKEAVGIIGIVNEASGNVGAMTFHVYNGGGNIPEYMRISSTGNVGILTPSPNGRLSIRAQISNTPSLLFQNGFGGPSSAISNYESAAQTYTVIGTNAYVNDTANIARFNASYAGCYIAFDEGTMVFGTGDASANPSSRMNISPSGTVNFLVTTRSPNYGLLRASGFRGGLYTYDAVVGSGTDYGVTIFAEGGTGGGNIYFCPNGSATKVMTINTSSNVLIGTTSDTGGKLQVSGGDIRVSGGIRFSSSGADANRWSVYWNGGTGDLIVVNNISDIRAKKDFDYNIKGLETIKKLKPLKFTWKDGTSHSTSVSGRLRQYGFIAQETMEADDYLAWYNQNQDTWGIEQYESFSAVIVKAIQELSAKIETLETEIQILKN